MNALTEETLVWLAALTVVAILVVARRKRSLKTTRTTDPVKSCIYNPREFRSPRNQSAGADRSSSGASAHDRLVQALKGDERRAARLTKYEMKRYKKQGITREDAAKKALAKFENNKKRRAMKRAR